MIKSFFYILGFVVLLLKPGDLMGRRVSVSSGSEKPQISMEKNSNGVTISINISGFNVTEAPDNDYTLLTIPDFDLSLNSMDPLLPCLTRVIEIPFGYTCEIETIDKTGVPFTLESLGMEHPIAPVPINLRVDDDPSSPVLRKSGIYASDQFFPKQLASLGAQGTMLNRNFALVKICPVQYNPVNNNIIFYKYLSVHLKFVPNNSAFSVQSQSIPGGNAVNLVLDQFTKTENAATGVNADIDYLIITLLDFASTLRDFAEWKIQKGYDVQFAFVENIGQDASSIQQYIKSVYNNAPPGYVLLAGDAARIPPFTGKFALNPHVPHVTDLYYGTMDGEDDLFPDMLVGRFPAVDTTQLRNMIEKSVSYEKLLGVDKSWLEKAAFVSTKDVNFHEFVEKGHRDTIHKYLQQQNMTADTIRAFYNNNKTLLDESIKQGVSLVAYSGHGSEYEWSDLGPAGNGYNLVDIYYLENLGKYPVVFSFGCNAGNLSLVECMGKSWLNYKDTGASLFWGAADLSYWHQDYYLQDRVFNAAVNKNYSSVAQMTTDALFSIYARGYENFGYYLEIYNILGDPSLPLWLGKPGQLYISAPDTLNRGTYLVDISVHNANGPVDNALVAVTQNNRLLGAGFTNNGLVTIQLDTPAGIENLQVTATSAFHLPVMDSIAIPVVPLVTMQVAEPFANKSTTIHFNVKTSSNTPIKDYTIKASGFGLSQKLQCVTDAAGNADLTLNSPYGQKVYFSGHANNKKTITFYDSVLVKGEAYIYGVWSIFNKDVNTNGGFIPGIQGQMSVSFDYPPDSIYVQGSGLDTVFTSIPIVITPKDFGDVIVSFAKSGYNITKITAQTRDMLTDVSGNVYENKYAAKVPNVALTLESLFDGRSYRTLSDSAGIYLFNQIPVGLYKRRAEKFAFHLYSDSVYVAFEAAQPHIELDWLLSGSINGQVDAENLFDDRGIVVSILGQSVQDTTDENGNFFLNNVVPGNITIMASRNGFRDTTKVVVLEEGSTLENISLFLKQGANVKQYDFETNNGGFTALSQWMWGKPGPGLLYHGPDNAFSGERVWATVLDGDYSANADASLYSPGFSLTGFTDPVLQFYHFYSMEYYNTGYDGGNVKISDDGGKTWSVITPIDNYPCPAFREENHILSGEPGFSGKQQSWDLVQYNLSAWKDKHVMIRFHFAGSGIFQDAGWYLDDIAVVNGLNTQINETLSGIPEKFDLLPVYPNPFNESTTIEFNLPEPGTIRIDVFNMMGQVIKTYVKQYSSPGRYKLSWEGITNTGVQAGSGIYFIKAVNNSQVFYGKMILLR